MNTKQGICSFEGMRYTHLDVDFGGNEDHILMTKTKSPRLSFYHLFRLYNLDETNSSEMKHIERNSL